MPSSEPRRSILLRLVLAVLIVLADLGVYAALEPGTLARRTVHYGRTSFTFRLVHRHEDVFAQWTVSPGGGSTTMNLGSGADLDTSDAEILVDEARHVVTMRVDDAALEYDLVSREVTPLE
jgi:hypothetical protein